MQFKNFGFILLSFYWDNYQTLATGCFELFTISYSVVRYDVTAVIYCSTVCLVMSIYYYLLRPHTPPDELVRINDELKLLNLNFH